MNSMEGLEPSLRALIAYAGYPRAIQVEFGSSSLACIAFLPCFQPVRHFPGSQCLVFKPTRLLLTYIVSRYLLVRS